MNNNIENSLRKYMKLPHTVVLKRDVEGDIIARVKELEGCVADGKNEVEALANLEQVKELWITAALKSGQEIPHPEEEEELPSGKWLTRVPRSLHKRLIELAEQEGTSLNQLVAVALAEAVGRRTVVSEKIITLEASGHRLEDYAISQHGLFVVKSTSPSAVASLDTEEDNSFLNNLASTKSNVRNWHYQKGGEAIA